MCIFLLSAITLKYCILAPLNAFQKDRPASAFEYIRGLRQKNWVINPKCVKPSAKQSIDCVNFFRYMNLYPVK